MRSESSVYVFPVTNFDNQDCQSAIVDIIDDTIVANTDTIERGIAGQFLDTGWARVVRKPVDRRYYTSVIFSIDGFEVFFDPACVTNLVGLHR